MREREQNSYRYTECGLDNVYIQGFDPAVGDQGEEVFHIPDVNGLHKLIAYGIVHCDAAMSGRELRFLRTEMGLTQAQLAKHVHRDAQTIARWEKGQTPVLEAAEVIIRVLAVEKLGLEGYTSIEDVAAKCVPSAIINCIRIDRSSTGEYRLAA